MICQDCRAELYEHYLAIFKRMFWPKLFNEDRAKFADEGFWIEFARYYGDLAELRILKGQA